MEPSTACGVVASGPLPKAHCGRGTIGHDGLCSVTVTCGTLPCYRGWGSRGPHRATAAETMLTNAISPKGFAFFVERYFFLRAFPFYVEHAIFLEAISNFVLQKGILLKVIHIYAEKMIFVR